MNIQFLDIIYQDRVTNPIEFLFWPLVMSMIIIGIVRLRSPKNLFYLYKMLESNTHLHLYLREGFNINGLSSFLLQFNYFLVLGTLFYSVYQYSNNPDEVDYFILSICYLGPFIFFLSKVVVVRVLEYLTETSHGFFEYLANYKVFFQIQGIALLPLALSLIFSDVEMKKYLALIAIGVIVLFSLFRTILSILYAVRYGFSFIYIFLYLCTLEFLPLLVIIKVFSVRILGDI